MVEIIGEADAGECGFSSTGNHWDPTFGCGGASEWQRKQCDGTDANLQGEIYPDSCCRTLPDTVTGLGPDGKKTCDPQNPHVTCELGDLSGRLEQIKVDTHLPQVFKDEFIADVNDFKDFFIVIHCGSPRVACGNFVVV